MAAALLDHHAAGRARVRSAGSAPAAEANPAVREAMAEIGLDANFSPSWYPLQAGLAKSADPPSG